MSHFLPGKFLQKKFNHIHHSLIKHSGTNKNDAEKETIAVRSLLPCNTETKRVPFFFNIISCFYTEYITSSYNDNQATQLYTSSILVKAINMAKKEPSVLHNKTTYIFFPPPSELPQCLCIRRSKITEKIKMDDKMEPRRGSPDTKMEISLLLSLHEVDGYSCIQEHKRKRTNIIDREYTEGVTSKKTRR